MNKLLDKLVLFTLCLAVYLMHESGSYTVVPVIIAVLASAADACFSNIHIKLCCFTAYTAACVFAPPLLFFLPELCYDLPSEQWLWLLETALPVCAAFFRGQAYIGIFALLLISAGWLMSFRTATLEKSESEYIALRDSAKELSMKLENKNRELLQRQDYEINLATLNERNRIARDIHDSVGHVISSAILQVGAIMATCADAALKPRLETVKGTLTQGMDSIRSSVHDLYDESVDLYTELRGVVGSFAYCHVTFDFDMDGNPT
jgi:signal transduction histidine kinase